MSVITKRFIECDRCGAVEPFGENEVLSDLQDKHPGWGRIDGERVLCPECYEEYDIINARHKVEMDGFMRSANAPEPK